MAKKRKQSTKRKTKARKKGKKRGSKKKPGTTRRDASVNSGLQTQYFSRIKREYHDIDYVDKLSEKDKAWLSAFMDEDLGARFNHGGKNIYKRKRDRTASYNRNNARNRDQYAIAKATGATVDIPTDQAYQYWEENYVSEDYETNLIKDMFGKENDEILSLEKYEELKDQMTEEARAFYTKYYNLAK